MIATAAFLIGENYYYTNTDEEPSPGAFLLLLALFMWFDYTCIKAL